MLVGVFSVNEGRNLEAIVDQVLEEGPGLQASVLLLDESTEPDSLAIVARLLERPGVRRVPRPAGVRGKVPALNALFAEFLGSNADVLLHFDADQSLRPGCVSRMVSAVRDGADLAAAVSYAAPGRTWFERAVRLTQRPGELERSRTGGTDPLLGHNGAYSRRAVQQLAPVPQGGVNEELFLLCLGEARGLRREILTSAAAEFRLPSTPRDYIVGAQRVQNRAAAFLRWCDGNDPTGSLGRRARAVTARVYRPPSPGTILAALGEDPLAGLLLPAVLSLKLWVRFRRRPSDSDVWDPVRSSKGFDR